MDPVARPLRTLPARMALAAALALGSVVAAAGAAPGGARLADLPQHWLDDDGRELALARLTGQRVLLTMAYASCHKICPVTIDSLKKVQRALDARGEQAQIVVVGYDPANDDPAVWRQYRSSRHLNRANWHFLTGSAQDTERLARTLGFDFWKYDEHVMHGSRVLVFDADGAPQSAFGPETPDWAAAL
jgi:cytochrome oxidase Cu insertion factor (SCO1/SenC/PrrC family)